MPAGTAEIVIVIEDADSPTPAPLVHAILVGLPGRDGGLVEGELKSPGAAGTPPIGSARTRSSRPSICRPTRRPGTARTAMPCRSSRSTAPLALDAEPGRGALVSALKGHVVATGLLIGTYERA